jgi:phosphatidylglycerophosphate synthase
MVPGSVARDLAAGLLLALAAAGATWWLAGPPASHVAVAASLYLGLAVLIIRRLPPDLPGPGIGSANRVTLGRAALAMPVMALAVGPAGAEPATAWWVIALSTVVLALDGVDGRVARRTDTRSAFGARFDMEVDAALILALSIQVWTSGRAGAWALSIGLMRYLFVAAARVRPALGAELPESLRRKVVCVIQGVVLLVALGPIIPDGPATAVLVAGLVALVYSFAVDVLWALQHERAVRGTR